MTHKSRKGFKREKWKRGERGRERKREEERGEARDTEGEKLQ